MSFFGTLLSCSRQKQRWFTSKNIPLEAFSDCLSVAKWVMDYQARYNRYPSLLAAQERFPKADLTPDKGETLEVSLQRVLDRELFRRMSGLVTKAKKLVDDGDSMTSVAAYMRQAVSGLDNWANDCSDLDQTSDLPVSRYKDRANQVADAFSMAPSPWPSYNKLIGLCEPGEHLVLAARPSIGKTWIALYWADYVRSLGQTVLFISKEMPGETILNRLECLRYGLPYSVFRKGKLSPKELRRWYDLRAKPLTGKLIVSSSESLSGTDLSQLTSKIEEYSPGFVVVDGAYLTYPSGIRFSSDVQRFGYISNFSKRLAKAKGTVIMSCIQMNRDAENAEGDTTPSLINLYGADAWAQDADVVLAISGKRAGNTRTLSIIKGRDSAIGDFNVHFSLTPPRFSQFAAASGTCLDSEFKAAV